METIHPLNLFLKELLTNYLSDMKKYRLLVQIITITNTFYN